MTRQEAEKYIRRIRNSRKRAFAEAWLQYLLGQNSKPDYKSFGLSYLGGQSVWMTLPDQLTQ
jgi:hypothetical protein